MTQTGYLIAGHGKVGDNIIFLTFALLQFRPYSPRHSFLLQALGLMSAHANTAACSAHKKPTSTRTHK